MDFDILPTHVSTTVPAYLLVLWMRYDGRNQLNDILARMDNIASRPDINKFSMRCARWRFDNCLKSWNDAHGIFTALKEQEDIEALLSPQQIQANTTRGLTPGPSQGLGPTAIVPVVSRKTRLAQVKAARGARYFDVNNLSSLSESETDERSRKSRAQHRRKRRHALKKQKAVGQALQSGQGGQAVIIPGRSIALVLQPAQALVFKNVIIIPDKDDSTFVEDGKDLEGGNSDGDDCIVDDATEENEKGDMEEDDGRDEYVNESYDESESLNGAKPVDGNPEDADDKVDGPGTNNQDVDITNTHSQISWIDTHDAEIEPIAPLPDIFLYNNISNEIAYEGALPDHSLKLDHRSPKHQETATSRSDPGLRPLSQATETDL